MLIDSNIYYLNYFIQYRIKYPNIGTYKNDPLDYLTVVTLPDTKEIITMYPTYQNCEEIKDNENQIINQKVKEKTIPRMSQIEKFNKKYNLKN